MNVSTLMNPQQYQKSPLMRYWPLLLLFISIAGHSAPASIGFKAKNEFIADIIPDYSKERAVYQLAKNALEDSDFSSFDKYLSQLGHYPLAPYLEAERLKTEFATLPIEKIDAFITKYNDNYVSRRFKSHWLNFLGLQKHWQLYDEYYDNSQNTYSHLCFGHLATLAINNDDNSDVLNNSLDLWQKPYQLPSACSPLLKHVEQAGIISHNIAFTAFQKAYANKNDRHARRLMKHLSNTQRDWAEKLLNPKKHQAFWLVELSKPTQQQPLTSATVKRLLSRISSVDHPAIADLMISHPLDSLENHDKLAMKRLSAWYIAKTSGKKAYEWLELQNEQHEPSVQEQKLRFSLQSKEWVAYRKFYRNSSKKLQAKAEWRYWQSLALLNTKRKREAQQAQQLLKTLSKERGYYGFLAARYFQQEAAINNNDAMIATTINPAIYQRFATAIELFHVGEHKLAHRVWHYESRYLPKKRWAEVAALAQHINWHERAIHAFAKAKLFDAIAGRFPLAYDEDFEQSASHVNVDKSWLLSMARQESAFSTQAKSHKGALGVLQLMPRTAKKVAQKNNIAFSQKKLLEADYNIRLASLYLKEMLEVFDNNYILATAAYNAGPNRIKEWLSLRPINDDWAHWVATIPYKETRNYVQNILAYSHIYQSLLPKKDIKLGLLHQDMSDAF